MEEARAFSEGTLRPMIKEKFGAEPSIEYFEVPVVVDNLSGEIISDSQQAEET